MFTYFPHTHTHTHKQTNNTHKHAIDNSDQAPFLSIVFYHKHDHLANNTIYTHTHTTQHNTDTHTHTQTNKHTHTQGITRARSHHPLKNSLQFERYRSGWRPENKIVSRFNSFANVTAKHHTPYVCGFAWSDMVHGCMVYTELAPRRHQCHMAPVM